MTTDPRKLPNQQPQLRLPDQVSFSADRSRLVAIDSNGANAAHLYDVHKGRLVRQIFKSRATLRMISLSPDGNWVAAGTTSGRRAVLRLVSVESGEVVGDREFPHVEGELPVTIFAITFHPSSAKVAVALSDGTLLLLDAQTGAELAATKISEKLSVHALTFSPNGERLACALGGRTEGTSCVRLLDTFQWREVYTLPIEGGADGVAFSPDGSTLAVVDHSGRLWVYGSAEKN